MHIMLKIQLDYVVITCYCYYKCSVALPHNAVGGLQYVIMVFPDYTHILFLCV